MVKDEIWSVSIDRAGAFFQAQQDVIEESHMVFRFGACRITLKEAAPKQMRDWAMPRVQVYIEGEESDVKKIYHRFMLQFLTAGG